MLTIFVTDLWLDLYVKHETQIILKVKLLRHIIQMSH